MGLISTAEDRRGRSVGAAAAARHARHVGASLLCHVYSMGCIHYQHEQYVIFTSSHQSRFGPLVTAPATQMVVVLRTSQPSATLLNCLGFGKLPSPSFNTKNHKKKMVHSSPRSYPYADHDLVMPFFHDQSRIARRPVSACWRSLTRDPRFSTTCMKHTDPSTCRRKKEASVTYKGPHRQCMYHYTCFAATG